ncbi:UNVERIFIED_CONTAM: hypothetical protein Scaly_0037000 [Sesamum calycinum]|uniref:Uncharacterized protein n=1 Tax=Sesamum calycinum TaxID=2727403 RepID=A0AAW2STI0_9LAMI
MGMEDSSSSSGSSHRRVVSATSDADDGTPRASSPSATSTVAQTLMLLESDDPNLRVQAAKDIRRLTKTSQRYRRHFSGAVGPLVDMLHCGCADANEAALAAILNLAVKDDTNKINIIHAGALKPIICFLQSENVTLQEYAAAALITLSASSVNKPIISASGAIPFLVDILRNGGSQARTDAVLALYNLSTHPDNLSLILQTEPIPPLINLLNSSKEVFQNSRKVYCFNRIFVVEVLESGSLQSREHAVGALLKMCQSDRSKYREPILREGVIPGLLELTVQGTAKSQLKAQSLLKLLRDSPYPRSELQPDTLENIVCNIMSQIDGEDQTGKAKQMLSEMVKVSMEQSLRHLQQRALVCTPADLPINSCSSEVPSK